MRRTSFTQELRELAQAAGEGIDAGGCWREVIFLHQELGRRENALGRGAWMMRYGQRGEWRGALRDAAAETRQGRRVASEFNEDRLRRAAGCMREHGASDCETYPKLVHPTPRVDGGGLVRRLVEEYRLASRFDRGPQCERLGGCDEVRVHGHCRHG